VLRSQLENAVIALLSGFLSDDLTKLEQMKEAYASSRQGMKDANPYSVTFYLLL